MRRVRQISAACVIALSSASGAGCGSHGHAAVHERGLPSAARAPIALADLHGRIVFSRRDDIWTANADGSGLRRLTARLGSEFDPSWSPDGKQIAYRDSRRGINVNDEIYVMDADGTDARNLTRSPSNEWSPSWSPDGRLIAFYSGELFLVRRDGSHRHAVTKVEGEYPAWSPDGGRLAFMSAQPDARGPDPNYDVFVVARDGSGLRQLTDWPGEDGWPAWSPDGRWIAFTSTHNETAGERSIWIMRSDGRQKHRVASGEFPVWSPDGRYVMLSGGDQSHLFVVRPDGSGLRRWPVDGWLPDWRR